jgi:hypothetical protein
LKLFRNLISDFSQTKLTFDSSIITPRLLGALPTENFESNFCQLVDWEGVVEENPKHHVIAVDKPQSCFSNSPQVFCSTFEDEAFEICRAREASPVVCRNNSVISGFLLSQDRKCAILDGRLSIEYHSVGDFLEWIEQVSGAEHIGKISNLLFVFVILISARNFS